MAISFEEKMEKSYEMASAKYEGFDEMEPEEQHYLSWEFYQQLCYDEEAEYWAPVIRAMDRMEKEETFDNPQDLREWQAGEVD